MATRPPPRRGGEHPTYGIYIGGSELDNEYKLVGGRHYKYTSQRRSAKVINSIEQALLKAIDSTELSKFNGSLETTPSTKDNELDKEAFVKQLKKKVRLHGQQSFYAIAYNGEILSLFDHYHKFTVEEVIDQHELRCNEPNPDLDPETNLETDISKQLRFETYDEYEFDDFGLSRLVVESLLSPALLERIITRFGNDELFETYSGQILFVMALDTCNASVQRDVAGAQSRYNSLTLDSYPGEDVTELATEALRLIHILAGSYALPLNLGTTLIKKVTKTSSEFFNRKMFELLDKARTMETKYKLLDPASMGKDPAYTTCGPYAVCAALQEEHGKLISDSDWPALAVKLPESNSAGTVDQSKAPEKSDPASIQCYKCKQWGHKSNDPRCPLYKQKNTSSEGATKSPRFKAKEPWKYVEPKDLTAPIEIDDKKWFFCTKCKCRATGKVGYYQLSHTDASHDPHWRPEGNLSTVQDPDPTPAAPIRPPTTPQTLDDDLIFTGVNHTPVIVASRSVDEREKEAPQLPRQVVLLGPRRLTSDRQHVIDTSGLASGTTSNVIDFQTRTYENNENLNVNCAPVQTENVASISTKTAFHPLKIENNITSSAFDDDVSSTISTYWTLIFTSCYNAMYWLWRFISSVYTSRIACYYSELKYIASQTISLLAMDIQYNLKSIVLIVTSMLWMGINYFTVLHTNQISTRTTKVKSTGFPAKWLILTTTMFFSTFWNSQFFSVGLLMDPILTSITVRRNSSHTVAQDSRCTWNFLYNYNYDKWCDLYNQDETLPDKKIAFSDTNEINTTANIKFNINDFEQDQYFDAKSEINLSTEQFFFDTMDYEMPDLQLDLLPTTTHVINTLSNNILQDESQGNNAPTVSIEAGLELLKPAEIEMNVAMQNQQPIIMDTGASLAITGNKQDFLPDTYQEVTSLALGGMAAGAKIEGVGNVMWTFPCDNGDQMAIILKCYLVPSANARLLSPQRIFDKQNGQPGRFWGDEESFYLEYKDKPTITIKYSPDSNLPIAYALPISSDQAQQVNLTLLDEANQNLTAGQKLLLEYHYRFGHTNMPLVQQILRTEGFPAGKFAAATKCPVPRCSICEYAKAHRRSTRGHTHTPNPNRDGSLKVNDLRPGNTVSVDHFESRLKGRTFDSFGKATSDKYIGGCIFVDHASGYVHIEFQLGFSAIETIRAKQNFEKFAFNNGVIPITYLTDSGAFKANKFVQHIRDNNQKIQYCGTNAHHQNGVAERAIRTISNMARAMLLHAASHWRHGIDSSMWPMAVQYAAHVYNSLPRANNISPSDIFFGTRVPSHKLQNIHVWGCPVYVLNPSLQAGQKIPRWEPRSKRGLFCGLSNVHSSEVPQVLNLTTGSITTQFHVVFDDLFTTVHSIERENEPPSHWNDLCLENTELIPMDNPAPLSPEWLSEMDSTLDNRTVTRTNQVRTDLTSHSTLPHHDPLLMPTPHGQPPAATRIPEGDPTGSEDSRTSEGGLPVSEGGTDQQQVVTNRPSTSPEGESRAASSASNLRRSPRTTKGQYSSTRYINEVFLTQVTNLDDLSNHNAMLAYQAELQTDMDSFEIDISDPRVYNAKFAKRGTDPDAPTFNQALSGLEADKYIEAMKEEITNLKRMDTWILVDREPNMKVLKGTWAFRLKRTPDGVAYRHRSRFCVRGDQQEYGVNYFETFAPVVQWSTIRLLLILILTNKWTTRVIDYTNAFPQANIDTDIYVEMPALFGNKAGGDKVLKLKKSLYGLKQSPRTFYQHLSQGLQTRGWKPSVIDPCLFMKNKMICVIYVDDTIFAGPSQQDIDAEVTSLGIKHKSEDRPFEFRDEGEVSAFLGIKIDQLSNDEYYLSQPGLITKVLKAAGMIDCNPNATPSALEPLGPDIDGDPISESWEYASIIGMLMYLANNTRPDIAHAVHACARYTHNPKKSHATAVKHILRYLQGTKLKGMLIKPNLKDELNCFVDSDFAGLYPVYPDQDPSSTKSRTGYVILYQGCPILWVSKMQTQCALSTMESEYLALSQSMRDLIPLREVLKEINDVVFKKEQLIPRCSTNSKSFSDIITSEHESTIPQSKVYEDNAACLKFARLPRLTPRTKHIAVPYHWFRTKVEQMEIVIEPISTDKQLADQFTKSLPMDKFLNARKELMGW